VILISTKDAYSLTIFLGCIGLLVLNQYGYIDVTKINILKLFGGIFIAGLFAMSVAKIVKK
jgi:hypothetical protein